MGVAIAQWICLRLYAPVLGSNSKHTMYAFSIYSQILHYICHCVDKNETIWGRIRPIFLKRVVEYSTLCKKKYGDLQLK